MFGKMVQDQVQLDAPGPGLGLVYLGNDNRACLQLQVNHEPNSYPTIYRPQRPNQDSPCCICYQGLHEPYLGWPLMKVLDFRPKNCFRSVPRWARAKNVMGPPSPFTEKTGSLSKNSWKLRHGKGTETRPNLSAKILNLVPIPTHTSMFMYLYIIMKSPFHCFT